MNSTRRAGSFELSYVGCSTRLSPFVTDLGGLTQQAAIGVESDRLEKTTEQATTTTTGVARSLMVVI